MSSEENISENKTHVVVIDDEAPVRNTVEQFLQIKKFEVHTAASGAQGIELVREFRPPIVLTDVMMPQMSGIEVLKAIKGINPETIVVIMTGYSTENLVLEAFQYGASNYLKKPFDFKSFSEVLDQVVRIVRSKQQMRISRSSLLDFHVQGMIDISADPIRAGDAIGGLINEIKPFINSDDIDSLHMGLYELVMNSIEHGVFKIGYDLKTQAHEDNTLSKIYQERMNSEQYAGWIHLSFDITPEESRFTVEDSGDGFDVEALPDPTVEETLLMSHGRGVMLTRMIADKLEFNDKGNRALLVKFQQPPADLSD